MSGQAVWARLQSFGAFVFTIIVLAGVALLLFLPLFFRSSSMQSEVWKLDQEITKQEKLEKQQRTEVEALKTDAAFVERTARSKLNLARPNETIFRFEPAPVSAIPAQPRR